LAETQIKEFDAVRITNFAIKYKGETESTEFGCVGTLGGETVLITKTKNCEGVPAKKKSVPVSMNLTVNAHIKVDTARKIWGLSNDGLKPGIYAYGGDSKSAQFCLTADVIDEFEDVVKKIAFPNSSSTTGLTLNVENGAEEIAQLELSFEVLMDELRKLYYEAFEVDMDETIKTQWHQNFSPELVKLIPTP
jgi:hypothetical protein